MVPSSRFICKTATVALPMLDSSAFCGLIHADLAFGPGLDQMVCDGDRRWHPQMWVFACQRGEHIVAAKPLDVGHLSVVDVDVGGQRLSMTADHQR